VIPILPNYAKELGGSAMWTGIVVGIYALCSFIATPIWGNLSDRYGRRPLLLYTIVFSTVAYFMFSFATTIWLLLLCRAIAGLGSGNISVAQAYISDVSSPEKRTKMMGMIGAAFGMGFILGPPIGGFIAGELGFAWLGYITAMLCAINFILAYLFLEESLVEKKTKKLQIIPIDLYKQSFSIKQRAFIFIYNFFFVSAFSMFQITATLLWEDKYGYNEKQRGYLFMFIGLCNAIVQAGLISVFKKYLSEKKLVIIGSVTMGLCILSIPFMSKNLFIPYQLLALAVMTIANGGIGPSLLTTLSLTGESNEQGALMGIFQSMGSLARLAGPVIGSLLYAYDIHAPYICAFAIMLFILFLVNGIFKKQESSVLSV
jgi:multidrug resistance protein